MLPSSEKRQAQACEGRARGESSFGAAAGPGLRNPVRWISQRGRRVGPAFPTLGGLSKVRWHCSARRARGQKTKTRVDQRSTRVFAFPWRGGASFCVCAAAPRQATKAGNQRSRNSYPGFRPQQTPAQPKPRPILRAFLRFPGAAAPLKATKAGNQRSRSSYPGFRPRQSPARPKPRYKAKSRVDRSSTPEQLSRILATARASTTWK